jgi:capsular exopolysaccharide synthesis family protein
MRDLALAMIIGLTLGVGLAFLLEHLDDSIKSLDDVEKACSLPSLGVVPRLGGNGSMGLPRGQKTQISGIRGYLPRLQQGGKVEVEAADLDLIVYKEPKSLISEAIGHVYSSIMLSASGRPPQAIMVTSPNSSEGKTSLVSNLAQSYALNGRASVLMDCDLRKPRIHSIFDLNLQPGLTNYLSGMATLEEILQPTEIPNLSAIAGGTRPPSPTNLLNSEPFKELLIKLRERFNHIIIDTPPVLGFADARFVSMLVDGVLLVTRYNSTHKSAGRMAHQLLSQAPMLGVILNAVGPYGQTYGNYYYYHQYQGYSKYYGDSTK